MESLNLPFVLNKWWRTSSKVNRCYSMQCNAWYATNWILAHSKCCIVIWLVRDDILDNRLKLKRKRCNKSIVSKTQILYEKPFIISKNPWKSNLIMSHNRSMYVDGIQEPSSRIVYCIIRICMTTCKSTFAVQMEKLRANTIHNSNELNATSSFKKYTSFLHAP